MKKMHLKSRVGTYLSEYYISGWFIPMMVNFEFWFNYQASY